MSGITGTVGVIGAGVMGLGVTQCLLMSGYSVILCDISEEAFAGIESKLKDNIRMQMIINKKVKEVKVDIKNQLTLTHDIEDMKETAAVIENIYEDFIEKKKVYEQLDVVCPEECVFMANTSCLSITKLAACTKRPGKIIGTHFMNPVYLIETVEVIKGYHTTAETVSFTDEFMQSLSKKIIVVNDSPGFVSNRISHLMINEAAFLLEEGVSDVRSIDEIFKQCYGHKMGPLETADLIGLDTVVMSLDVLFDSFRDTKFRCCPMLRKMVHAGLFGKKTGKGFYSYNSGFILND